MENGKKEAKQPLFIANSQLHVKLRKSLNKSNRDDHARALATRYLVITWSVMTIQFFIAN